MVMSFIVMFFGIMIILGIYVINVYNKYIFFRDRVFDKFKEVDKLLCDRVDFIDDIVKIVNDNKLHEDLLVRKLNSLKKSIDTQIDVNDRLLLFDEDIIDEALKLDKVYKKLGNKFSDIKDKYNNNKDRVMYAADIYNEEVLKYNNYRDNKIKKIVFDKFKFYEYNCYEK